MSGERGQNRTVNLLIKRADLSSLFCRMLDFSFTSRINRIRNGRLGRIGRWRRVQLLTKLLTRFQGAVPTEPESVGSEELSEVKGFDKVSRALLTCVDYNFEN